MSIGSKSFGSWPWIVLFAAICFLGFSVETCSDSRAEMQREKKLEENAIEAFRQVMDYTLNNHTEVRYGSHTGMIPGDARFSFFLDKNKISVTYTAMQYQVTEMGELSGLRLERNCGLTDEEEFYAVSIQGRWKPEGTGEGHLVIALSKDNVLNVIILGDNWQHWAEYSISSPDPLLEKFNNALIRKSELTKCYYPSVKTVEAENHDKALRQQKSLIENSPWWNDPYAYESPEWFFYDNWSFSIVTDSDTLKGTYTIDDSFALILLPDGQKAEKYVQDKVYKRIYRGRNYDLFSYKYKLQIEEEEQ